MFKPQDAVRWTSSNAHKEGVIVAVVPPGRLPRDVGYDKLGDTSLPRNHESYIVKGGEPGRRPKFYWPMVSLLNRAEGLTADEVAWCHQNAPRVRELMAT